MEDKKAMPKQPDPEQITEKELEDVSGGILIPAPLGPKKGKGVLTVDSDGKTEN